MRLLLDTNVLIWWLEGDRLSPEVVERLEATGTNTAVSAATLWEIEIKRTLGKLDAPDDVLDQVAASGFGQLPITAAHAVAAGRLPRHHDDPFDRMLIAQALAEQRTIVTRDRRFEQYGVAIAEA
ncbi:MAG: type II toxin-antitoxin system VapC family toxin [Geodermatophilaceae bacterium]|nr:type II toxin-antitoxin system VapC family toxin [Geodermatophilaceae bacterium]